MSFGLNIIKYALVASLLILIGYCLAPYFAGTSQISATVLQISDLQIRWYGVTMALAIIASALCSIYFVLPKLKLVTENQLLDAMVWMIFGGVLGARLLFVLIKWTEYSNDISSIWRIWEGGLSLHGAIVGGMIALVIHTRSRYAGWAKISLKISDLVAVGLPLGQSIGRFGNFFNQEAFGGPTTLPWKMYVEPSMRPAGLAEYSYFHPTFAYEAILNILLFSLLCFVVPRYKFSGQLFVVYTGAYSFIRFFIEYFRIDSDYLGQLSIAQWASLIILAVSVGFYYFLNRKQGRSISL